MKTFIRLVALFSVFIPGSAFLKCGGEPIPNENIAGRVIKVEYCATDTLCLIASDILYPSNKRQYTDTLTVNGVLHTGVIKTYGLSLRYQTLGQKLAIGFEVISSQPKECTGRKAYKVPEVKILDVARGNYAL
jgi:hypothetical protein